MTLQAALFDLDGTLHDKSATLRRVADIQYGNAKLNTLGIAQSAWATAYVQLNNLRIEKSEVFGRLASTFALSPELQQSLHEEFDATLGTHAIAFAGAGELLQACKARGLKVGVVTNGRDAFQRSKVVGMGLNKFIDAVVTSGAYGRKKPDPAIFLECLSQLGVQPDRAVFVGDDFAADIEPALRLGMRAIFKSHLPASGAWLSSGSLFEISAAIRADA
ncbi:MAG: HAD family hydrolase [Rhizobacter sp.]|nr:HAD family hydrolase [Rhizobacter sp.]